MNGKKNRTELVQVNEINDIFILMKNIYEQINLKIRDEPKVD
jgi:hypothetical protein